MKRILLYLDCEPGSGGVFQYSQALLDAVLALPRDRFDVVVLYTHESWDPYLGAAPRKRFTPFGRHTRHLLRALLAGPVPLSWIRRLVKRQPVVCALEEERPDLCVFPSQETFWGYLVDVPSMWAIHDLMHRYESSFPEVSAYGRSRHRDRHFVRVCACACGLLVDSAVGRRHVHDAYGYPNEAIFSLPYIAPRYMHEHEHDPNASLTRAYDLPERFIFFPAQFWEHKNHLRLVEAVRRLRAELPDLRLVLAGSKKSGYAAVERKVKSDGLETIVTFLGFVPETDLAMLYRCAVALVLPTFFGPTNIPPLEAFVAGCPVAASRIYGMPEQLGDAALFFDPLSVDQIADVLRRLWTDDALRNQLRVRGHARSAAWGVPQFNRSFATIVETLLGEDRLLNGHQG